MKKVMVYAYTKYNLGDDLLVKILCDRYRDTQFFLYTYEQYKEVLACCENLRIYANSSPFSKMMNRLGQLFGRTNAFERSLAKNCDLCVCITGSLFIQGREGWESYLDYMTSRKIKKKPYFQLGSNFGPYSDPKFLQGFTELFQSYTDICFREKHSYELFSELENVRFAPDIVLSGDYQRFTADGCEKRVACSVIDLSGRAGLSQYKSRYLQTMEALCRKYLEEGYTVDLLSFCRDEGDENAIDELERRVQDPRLIHHRYCTDATLEEMLECIGRAEIVIAGRFHAMILGWCMKKKTLPVVYSPKMKHVMDDFGYTGRKYDIIQDRFLGTEQMTPEIFDVAEFSKDAQRQFEKLDQYLR